VDWLPLLGFYIGFFPLVLWDPTGHRECGADDDCNETLPYDPGPPPVPQNPWEITDEMLDTNGDGVVDPKEGLIAYENLQAQAEQVFLSGLTDPAPGLGTFGGCNTLRADCPNYHPAVDAGGDIGDAIVAAAYGMVVAVGNVGGAGPNFGNYVVIEHNVYGVVFYTVYVHLDTVSVEVGDIVDAGVSIGTMGDTNGQGSVHVHFEVRRQGNIGLDPAANNPFLGSYWFDSEDDLITDWVDLGPVYGYSQDYLDTGWTTRWCLTTLCRERME
jgi:hypothetical protein